MANGDPPRVAVVEAHPELKPASDGWERLAEDVANANVDLLVLNELPSVPGSRSWMRSTQ